MSAVDPPDRVKWSDKILDWIADYRREWEARLATQHLVNVGTEWIAIYVAQQACTLENAPIADRRAVIREIKAVMAEANLPIELP